MNTDLIVEKYKKYCTKLKSAEMLLLKDIESIKNLERFISEGKVKADDVIKAFKKANKSKFLTGQVKDFQADIRWMCNPVNIEKVNSGKYDDKPKKASFDFSGEEEKELELEQHLRNQEKLKKIRADRHHQEWLKNYWFNKYPNLRSEEDGKDTNIYS
jgi:hypothetical protein